jgi:hypothetical protein
MASLADLLASVNTGNMTGQGLPQQQVAFQRPRGFLNTVGKIADAMAALGQQPTNYRNAIDAEEKAYNQAVQQQRQANVFRDFAMAPDSPEAQAMLAQNDPDTFMKVAPRNQMLGNRVVRAGPFGTPEVVLDAPAPAPAAPRNLPGFAGQLQARRDAFPDGSPEARMLDAYIAAQINKQERLATGPAASGGGGSGGGGYRLLGEDELPEGLRGTGSYQVDPKGKIVRVNTGAGAGKPGAIGSPAQLAILDEGIADLRRAEELLMGGNITGPFIGAQPEWMQNFTASDTITAQEAVARVAQKELRAILGGQFAQKEGEALIKRAFNPSQSEAENLKRVRSLIRQVQARRDELAGKIQTPSAGGAPTATDAQGRRVMWNGTAWVPAR